MIWKPLTEAAQLDAIKQESQLRPVVIFKHSTRCSISHMAKARPERSTPPEGIDFYFLDLIQYRNLSNDIAERFAVYHESPQVLLIRQGECVYDQSHNGITMEDIAEQAFSAN